MALHSLLFKREVWEVQAGDAGRGNNFISPRTNVFVYRYPPLSICLYPNITHVFVSVRQTEESSRGSDEKPGDGKKAGGILWEDAEPTSDEGITAVDTPAPLPTTESEHGVQLRQASIAVLNDSLPIDPTIPSSTESKSGVSYRMGGGNIPPGYVPPPPPQVCDQI